MSSANHVSEKVKTHLLPDEKVIGRFSSIWREYYATNKRLVGFQRPDWVQWLLILGLLPGILAMILTRREYMGACEYSKISGVSQVRIRQVIIALLATVVGVTMIVLGISILVTFGDQGGGLVLVIIGVFGFIALWLARPSFYQLRMEGLPKAEERKWFISKPKGLKHKNSADEFADLIMTKIKA